MNQFIHTQMHLDLQIKIRGRKKKQKSFQEPVDLPVEPESFPFSSPPKSNATGAKKEPTDRCELGQHESEPDPCFRKKEV